MSTKIRYAYSVARFSPDAIREECVNIGLLVGNAETGEIAVRSIKYAKRANCIDDKGVFPAARAALDMLGREFELLGVDDADVSESVTCDAWLRRKAGEYQNILRLTAPQWIMAEDAEAAAERLAVRFLVEPQQERAAFHTRKRALANLRKAYRAASFPEDVDFEDNPRIQSKTHGTIFDFVVANGHALQLAQAWSFQVNQDDLADKIRAWAFSVSELRDAGGSAVLNKKQVVVRRDIDIEVIYVPPLPGQATEVVQESFAMFKELGVTYVPMESADSIAGRAQVLAEKTSS